MDNKILLTVTISWIQIFEGLLSVILRKSKLMVHSIDMSDSEAHLLCVNVSSWPRWLIMLVSASGIFVSFLLNGVAHESLFTNYKINQTLFLTFVQFVGYAALSLPTAFKIITGKIKLQAKFYNYLITSLALTFSMSLTNFAASRVSYATGVLFKSSKLIPVMIGNIIFLKKKPKISEAVSISMIVVGLIGISLGDFKGKNKFDVLGIISIILSLVCGAVASNMEDKLMSIDGASQDEVIAMLYGLGSIIVGVAALVTGDMTNGFINCLQQPSSLMQLMFFGFLGAIGIQFVYLSMKVFGSLITVMLTSIRKAMTVCLSFLLFPNKHFTVYHGLSILLIAFGMAINIMEKTKTKKVSEDEKMLIDKTDDRPLSSYVSKEQKTDVI